MTSHLQPGTTTSGIQRRRLLTAASLLLAACLATPAALAQGPGTITGTLVGRVTDASSKIAFEGVRVTVNVNGVNYQTTTDQAGNYVLVDVPAGPATVNFTYIGLPAQSASTTVQSGQIAHLDLTMGQGDTAQGNKDVVQMGEFKVASSVLGTARAMNDKRNATALTEILASDAIGQLPDKNMTEAIQRLPGIEIVKDKGEGRYIEPRGISPAYVGLSMNGIRFSSTEKGTRESSMDVVSASLIGSIEVNKVPTPDTDADSMGGSVNLKTRSGFDQDGRIARLSVGGLYSHVEDMKGGYNMSATYGDQLLDGRLAFIVDLAADYRPYIDYAEKAKSWSLQKSPTDGQQHWANDSLEFDHYDVKRTRQGEAVGLDYKLNDTGKIYLRTFNTSYETGNQQWATIFPFTAGTLTALTDTTATSTLKAGGLIKSEQQIRNNKRFTSIIAGYDQTMEAWTNNFAVGWTHAKYTRPTLNISFANSAATGVSYDFSAGPYKPLITQVSGPSIAAPSSYTFNTKSAYSNTTANSTEKTIKDDIRRDFTLDNLPTYVKVGGEFRYKDVNLDGSKWNITKVPYVLDGNTTMPGVDVQDRQGGFPDLRIRQDVVQSFYEGNNQSQYGLVFDPKTTYGAAFTAHEEISSVYAMGGVTVDKLKITAGVRYESTDFHQNGWSINATTGAITPVQNGVNYNNTLPSVVFSYEITPRTIARASYSTSLARPDYNSTAPGRAVDDSKQTVTQGNVRLPALTSQNWDASVEHFYGRLGVISAAVFYKDIKNFTYNALAGTDPATGYTLTSYLTAPSAWIEGAELNWRQQLNFLPGLLSGLGLQANATIGNSEVTYPTRPGEKLKFPGFGHKFGNIAATYDYRDFSLRVAMHFHDNRMLANSTIGANYQQDEMEPFYKQIDVSSSYRFADKWRVYLNFSNANNAPLQQYWSGTPNVTRIDTLEQYGWYAEGGVTWSY